MGLYIRPHRRARLLKYKYSSIDKSLVSKYVLGPYWTWLVTLFPKTMAPNLITLSGLCCVLVNFGMLLYYNPTLACGTKPLHVSYGGPWDPLFAPASAVKSGWLSWLPKIGHAATSQNGVGATCAPQWLWFTFAVGLFAYQSLDAIDGKQARRTGTSGPLGELFDHGCDALNTTLEVILSAAAMNLGLSWWTIAALVATNANFYLTTWEEFHTGTLYLSEFSGPVEGILLVIGMFFVTGFTGPSFWDQGFLTVSGLDSVPFLAAHVKNLPLNDCFCIFSTIGLGFNVASSTMNVYRSLPAKNRTPAALVGPLTRLSPYLLHTAAMVAWLAAPASHVIGTTRLIPFLLFWGVSFAHHVGLLILSHLSAAPFPAAWKHPLLFLSVAGAVDANLGRLGAGWAPVVQVTEGRVAGVVWACLGAAVVVYGHFVYDVVGDICEFYDMNCLTIKPKAEKKAVSPADAALAKRHGDPDADTSSSGDDAAKVGAGVEKGKETAKATAVKAGKAVKRK